MYGRPYVQKTFNLISLCTFLTLNDTVIYILVNYAYFIDNLR